MIILTRMIIFLIVLVCLLLCDGLILRCLRCDSAFKWCLSSSRGDPTGLLGLSIFGLVIIIIQMLSIIISTISIVLVGLQGAHDCGVEDLFLRPRLQLLEVLLGQPVILR